MARSAVLTGRTVSDVVYNRGILIVLMVTGLLVGWTVRTGVPELLAGIGLLLLFAFAMAWLGSWLGLSVPSVEVAQQVAFTVLFPITFVSNAFVARTLPDWLQPFAEWNPTSTLTSSLRILLGQPEPADRLDEPGGYGPDPRDAALGRGDRPRLRVPGRPPLPLAEPLIDAGRGAGLRRPASSRWASCPKRSLTRASRLNVAQAPPGHDTQMHPPSTIDPLAGRAVAPKFVIGR